MRKSKEYKPLHNILHFIEMRNESREIDAFQTVSLGCFSTSFVTGKLDLDLLINMACDPTGNQAFQHVDLEYDQKMPMSINGKYFGCVVNVSRFDCNIAGNAELEYYVFNVIYNDGYFISLDKTVVEKLVERIRTGKYTLYVDRYEDRLYLDFQVEGLEYGNT